jgi:HlyD family secretion protein
MKRMLLPLVLALLGVAVAVVAIIDSNQPAPAPRAALSPARAPFATFVAGTGITEIGRGNIAIATPVAGVVATVAVKVGDRVAAGDPLFQIDVRDLQARLVVERAKVAEARAALDKPTHRLAYIDRLRHLDPGVVSAQSVSDLRDDVAAAVAAVQSAQAAAAQTQVDIARSLVRAPSSGTILQVNIRPGEYADTHVATPLMLMGDETRMYVRVDIDESDAWRVRPDARAIAFVRGNPALRTPLRYEYIEPYVTPRTSLTGLATERLDVRVLQVVYSFDRSRLPVYVGQQMDVFIQAPAVPAPAMNTPASGQGSPR